MKLYEITANYRELFDTFDNCDDLSDEEVQAYFDTLEAIEGEFDIKAENIACFIKELNGDIELFAAEISALKERKSAKEKLVARLKAMLIDNMQATGIKKIDRPRAKLSLRSNAESASIAEEAKFIKWAKENNCDYLRFSEPEVNKIAVKKALQSGEEIPGASLIRTASVIIK